MKILRLCLTMEYVVCIFLNGECVAQRFVNSEQNNNNKKKEEERNKIVISFKTKKPFLFLNTIF